MLTDKRILVVGASGRSGASAARLYYSLGATVFLSDLSRPSEAGPAPGEDPERWVDLRPRQETSLLDEVRPHMVVTAPGVPLSLEIFREATAREIPVYGENDLSYELIRLSPFWKEKPFFVGITGTDGKSTTTALLAHLIMETTPYEAIPCGNYGTPLSEFVLEPKDQCVFVVECSSFQLEPLTYFHPGISMILNVAEDHMDRYTDLQAYLRAKLRILELQDGRDLFLAPVWVAHQASLYERELRKGSGEVRKRAVDTERDALSDEIIFWDEKILDAADLPLKGIHNRINLHFALLALEDFSRRMGVWPDRNRVAAAVRSFDGLPHRMESLGERGGILFVNDSKATTVQALRSAVLSLAGREVHLLLGGRSKGTDFSSLKSLDDAGEQGPSRLVLYPFGESAAEIADATGCERRYTDLESAFRSAVARVRDEKRGGASAPVILLSPACSSHDAYRSYAERGDHFRRMVTEWDTSDA